MDKENNLAEIDVDQILEDLSYSWATPEAQHFHSLIKENKKSTAKNMLRKENLSEAQIKAVMNYFSKQLQEKKKLIEYFSYEFDNFSVDDDILVSYGGDIFSSKVYRDDTRVVFHNTSCFFDKNSISWVPLSKAKQIWKIEKQ